MRFKLPWAGERWRRRDTFLWLISDNEARNSRPSANTRADRKARQRKRFTEILSSGKIYRPDTNTNTNTNGLCVCVRMRADILWFEPKGLDPIWRYNSTILQFYNSKVAKPRNGRENLLLEIIIRFSIYIHIWSIYLSASLWKQQRQQQARTTARLSTALEFGNNWIELQTRLQLFGAVYPMCRLFNLAQCKTRTRTKGPRDRPKLLAAAKVNRHLLFLNSNQQTEKSPKRLSNVWPNNGLQ